MTDRVTPVNVRDFELLARDRLDPVHYDYFSGGAHDEARALEHLEVAGHGGEADGQRLRKIAHRRLALRELAQKRAPGRIGERGEGGAELVRRHQPYLTTSLNTAQARRSGFGKGSANGSRHHVEP